MADQSPISANRVRPLPIAKALRDRNCADVIAVDVSNIPPGAALSAGVDNGDGSWTLTPADLDGLILTPPADGFGEVVLTVIATAADPSGTDAPPTATAFGMTVDFGPAPSLPADVPPPAAPPETAADAAETTEDAGDTDATGGERTVALDIDIGLSTDDAPGPISVAIGGVPAGATLSSGADDGTGTWVLEATDLPGLALTLPAGAPDQITLGIAATAADGTSATGVLSLAVSELPDAPPEPSLPTVGPEPTFEPVFEPEPETVAAPDIVDEPVFTPDFVPDFVTDYETDASPAPMALPDIALPPVAYWKLDELLPGTVGDEIANHHGRSHGVAEGASGGAFDTVDSFDGIDDYIVVPHAQVLAPAAGALTMWFNAFAGGQATIAAKGSPVDGAYLALAIAGRRLRLVLGGGGAINVAQGGAFGAAEWNHATVTWGAGGMALYLNGEPMATDDYTGGLVDVDAPWLFGAADTGDGDIGDFFHGELDDIALYADQLDAATVRRLFHLGVNGLMHDEGAEFDEPPAVADGDSGLDLDDIPVEAGGPASLAVLDSEGEAVDDENERAAAAPEVVDVDDVVAPASAEDETAGGDSGLDLDSIPVEADGPASLAVLDADDEAADADTIIADDAPAATAADVAPGADADDEGVFVFGAGGDYFPAGDGWSDKVEPPPGDDAPAVEIAADGELTVSGGDKLEW